MSLDEQKRTITLLSDEVTNTRLQLDELNDWYAKRSRAESIGKEIMIQNHKKICD